MARAKLRNEFKSRTPMFWAAFLYLSAVEN